MFSKQSKKTIQVIWNVLVIIIILSMIMLYTPIFLPGGPHSTTVPVDTVEVPLEEVPVPSSEKSPAVIPPPTPTTNLDFSPL